jgi:hypothetical protein
MAGAQISGDSLGHACELLKVAIDDYLKSESDEE